MQRYVTIALANLLYVAYCTVTSSSTKVIVNNRILFSIHKFVILSLIYCRRYYFSLAPNVYLMNNEDLTVALFVEFLDYLCDKQLSWTEACSRVSQFICLDA